MECVLKCGKPCYIDDSIDKITDDKWNNIKLNAERWKALDKFGDVWETTNWDNGQKGRFMHNNCYITLCSSTKREQAIMRDSKKKKREAVEHTAVSTSPSHDNSDSHPTTPLKKKTRLSTGIIHKKDQCVWGMKKEDKKHLNRSSNQLLRIEQTSRWKDFKRHIIF